MQQVTHEFVIETRGQGLFDFSHAVDDWVKGCGFRTGLLTLFIQHTSASLTIQENADSDVLSDLRDFFSDLAPRARSYRHSAEGPDDMPAHIRAALTQTSLSIPLRNGRMALGIWQGLYVFEHRDRPHQRTVTAHMMGD